MAKITELTAKLALPVVEEAGCELWDVEYVREAGSWFLRIYIVVNKSQLYASIQNSAREELDFNERNYISTKRGNHGLGMKRVKALADKYDGYLTLANEPGIFAAEVTLPL